MGNIVRRINPSQIQASHPFDAVHQLSPAITSLMYADNQGRISSEMRPVLATFRTAEAAEKIEAIRGITQMYGYDSQVEINRESQHGLTTRTGMRETGLTTRTGLREDGKTNRVQIREHGLTTRQANAGETEIQLQKMKYNFGREVMKDHLEGQKYLSDNQLRATEIECRAYAETVQLAEFLRSQTAMQISSDRMVERIRESELKHASLIRQAEEARKLGQDTNRKEIAVAYIREQANINRAMITAIVAGEEALATTRAAYFEAFRDISLGGIDILKSGTSKRFRFVGDGTHGGMEIEMEVE